MCGNVLRQVKMEPPTRDQHFWRGTDRTLTPVSPGAICNHWEKPSCHTGHLQLLPTGIMLLQLFTMCAPGSVILMKTWWERMAAQRGHSSPRGAALCSGSPFRGPSYGKWCLFFFNLRSFVFLLKIRRDRYHSHVCLLRDLYLTYHKDWNQSSLYTFRKQTECHLFGVNDKTLQIKQQMSASSQPSQSMRQAEYTAD